MGVPVVQVRIVRMFVPQGLMAVPMGMWFGDFAFMSMLVMLIVHVAVLMFQSEMGMLMLVAFGQMKPETNRHQGTRDDELRCHRLLQH